MTPRHFMRRAYSAQVAHLANELLEWSRTYSSLSYRAPKLGVSGPSVAELERWSEELADLGIDLQRVAIRLRDLKR